MRLEIRRAGTKTGSEPVKGWEAGNEAERLGMRPRRRLGGRAWE